MLESAVSGIESSSVASQLSEAGILMGVGMMSVFMFLSLLIIAMLLLARLVKKFPGEQTEVSRPPRANTQSKAQSEKPTPQVVAAISAAIHQHRHNK